MSLPKILQRVLFSLQPVSSWSPSPRQYVCGRANVTPERVRAAANGRGELMTVNWAIRLGTAAVAMTVLSVGSAWAREDEIEPVPAPPPPAVTGKFDMAIGVSGTTDYQSRGITQSDSEPAIQGYIEPSYGLGPVLGDATREHMVLLKC